MSKLNKPKLSLPKPKLPLKGVFKRRPAPEERIKEAFANVPKITDETVAEHREDVLSSARKYIYPLQHSRKRIVSISTSIIILAVALLLVYIGLSLYRFQNTSSFIYGVTQVIPLPVAKVGGSWVSYESYLFELKRYLHYYETQQQVDFSTKSGQAQLSRYKQQAMNEVITNAYVNELASRHDVSVSSQQVNQEVTLVQSQNRLGSGQREFNDVLSDFWGWNEADFKRELKAQMLQQAVVAKLDTATEQRAQSALTSLNHGADFGTLATQVSDDASTKNNGGQFPDLISQNDPNVAPQITQALFSLKAGQISGIINTGYTLEIVKLISIQGDKVQAAHIAFNLAPISRYIAPLQKSQPKHVYIHI
ncbi:MAG: peptidylprolyl isomerase [Candidatus Saccharimonadales bacterium]